MYEANLQAARNPGSEPDVHHQRRAERGSGRLKTFVWLSLFAMLVFVLVKIGPVLMDEYQFQDTMRTTARYATVSRQSPDDIRKTLLQEAAKDDLPIKAEDITVTAKDGNVAIDAQYDVTVDLTFYQWTFNFHPTATNAAL